MNERAGGEARGDVSTVRIERVEWADPRAVALRARMDEEMGARYADRHPGITDEQLAARGRALAIDPSTIVAVFLGLDADGTPVAHAALRRLIVDGTPEWELKRVVTLPSHRAQGFSTALVRAVEQAAREAGGERLILQTGDRQPEAIALYEKLGYRRIPVYAPYAGALPESLCFARELA